MTRPTASRHGLLLAGTALSLTLAAPAMAQDTLNALVWCDHTDRSLIEPFEQAHGVRVNLREYEGTGSALAILEQSRPGDWDVLVIDAIDVFRAVEAGILAPLPADELPVADFFPEVVLEDLNVIDGTTWAVTEKFGYNTVSFNSDTVDPAAMEDLSALFSPEYAGRISIYDYYLPVLGLVAIEQGIATADITAETLETLRPRLMELRGLSRSVDDVVSAQTVLATGEVDIVLGGGEWLTAVLAEERPELTWTMPEQGAVLWAQSIAMLEGSSNPDLALEFIKYITSPEGQARLATSSCFWGMPANAEAAAHLSEAEREILRWDQQAEYLARAQFYPAPDDALDDMMQDLWLDMLQQ